MKNYLLIALSIFCIVTLIANGNIEKVFALSVTAYAGGITDLDGGTVRCGSKILVADGVNVAFFSATSPSTSLGTMALATNHLGCNSSSGRAFGYATTGTLSEIDVTNQAVLRTLATGCAGTQIFFDGANFYCFVTPTIRKINLDSMSIVYTSSTINTGASACNGLLGITYESTIDTMFGTCDTTNNIVAIVGYLTSGTPDFSAAEAITQPRSLAYNPDQDNLGVCGSTQVQVYNFTTGGGFTAWNILASGGCANIGYSSIDYVSAQNWYVALATDTDEIAFIDATLATSISSVGIGADIGTTSAMWFNSFTQIIIASSQETDFYVVDATGIDAGSGGGFPPPSDGGIDCSLPENAQILICRLGDNPNCNGTVLGCAGNFIVGNTTGDTGLTPIICSVGIVDCVANPDMKTNGVGYLLVTIALAIIIGILWVASRGDLNSIPTFIWFIATLAVVGAFTLMDLIDATFLVITVVFIIALAAAKARGLFGGGDFK